jgi:hypothetical protein
MSSGTSSLVDEIRARKDREEEARDFRALKRSAKRRNDADNDAAKHGYEAGREEERRRQSEKRHPSSSSSKRPAAKKRRRTPRPVRNASRQIARPLERQFTSGLKVLGLTLGLVALYLVLENASAASGALNGITRGIEWFRAPDRSIPYGPR